MKMKIVMVVCMAILMAHDGLSRETQQQPVIQVQDNRPVKKVEKRVYKRYAPYPYYSYPGWGWGGYSPWGWGWGSPYYGPGYYAPGVGFYVGF